MFLTKEILESKNACALGIKWLEHYFPDGGEIIEIMSHKHIPIDFLHWGYNHLYAESSNEEKEFFKAKLNIECEDLTTISHSVNIQDGSNIHHSKNVKNSHCVFIGKQITNSHVIHSSKNVENSKKVFQSENIFNSCKIYISSDVNKSNTIINSTQITNSFGVIYGNNIDTSGCIIGTENDIVNNIHSSYFISKSNNLTNCLFCVGMDSQEFLIFNKSVSEEEFNQYKTELFMQLQNWMPNFVSDWGSVANDTLSFPLINNYKDFFQYLPQEFLNWVQTLPNYDANLFAQIAII